MINTLFNFRHRKARGLISAFGLMMISFLAISFLHQSKALADCVVTSLGQTNGSCQETPRNIATQAATCLSLAGPNAVGWAWFVPSSVTVAADSGTTPIEVGSISCDGAASPYTVTYDTMSVINTYISGSGANAIDYQAPFYTFSNCVTHDNPCSTSSGWQHNQVCSTNVADLSPQQPCPTTNPPVQDGYANYDNQPLAPTDWTYEESTVYLNNAAFTQAGNVTVGFTGGAWLCFAPPFTTCEYTNLVNYGLNLTVTVPPELACGPSNPITVTENVSSGISMSVENNQPITNSVATFGSFMGRGDNASFDYSVDGDGVSDGAPPGNKNVVPTPSQIYSGTSSDSAVYSANETFRSVGTATAYWTVDWWYVNAGTTVTNVIHCSEPINVVQYLEPYFSVIGGDIVAGSTFGASTCTNNSGGLLDGILGWNTSTSSPGTYIGAGTTLAAQALGDISGVDSAEPPPGAAVNSSATAPTGLDLANDTSSVSNPTGQFGFAPCPPSYTASGTIKSHPSLDIGSLTGVVTDTYSSPTGVLDISDSSPTPIQPGTQITIYISAGTSAEIDTPITYATGGWLNGTGQPNLPSFRLIVLGGNIYIRSAVGEIDGTYVAEPTTPSSTTTGYIATCDNSSDHFAAQVNSSLCFTPLLVNGSFIAKDIYLERTGSSISSATPTPAEQFYYSPEEWLSASVTSTPLSSGNYASESALPPVL